MPKICQVIGCNNPVFNSKAGYCKFHMYKAKLSTKKKREGKYTKKKEKAIKNAYFGFKTQMEMFEYIWNTQPHVCWLTGRPLEAFDVKMCAHVLRKGTYTYFKLNPENIRLLHPTIHFLVDDFREELRDKLPHINFDKWFKLQEDMKIKYEEFKSKNLLS